MAMAPVSAHDSGWKWMIAATLMVVPLASTCLPAQSLESRWDDGGLNGRLKASGTLIASPCVLMPESQVQEITLGQVSMATLKRRGDVTVPVDVHIVLDRCPSGSRHYGARQDLRHRLWLADQRAVRMRILGDRADDDARFFSVKGASGISLRMEDALGNTLIPSLLSPPVALAQGRNDLVLKAQLWRNSDPLEAGEWQAVLNIGMEYE